MRSVGGRRSAVVIAVLLIAPPTPPQALHQGVRVTSALPGPSPVSVSQAEGQGSPAAPHVERRSRREAVLQRTAPTTRPIAAVDPTESVFAQGKSLVAVTPGVASDEAERMLLAVSIDGESLGDAFVVHTDEGTFLEVRALVDHGFEPSSLGGAIVPFRGIPFMRVDVAPLTAVLDEEAGELSIHVPPERLASRNLVIRATPEAIETQAPASFFLNGGGSWIGSSGSVSVEAGLRHGNLFVGSSAFWDSVSERVVRGSTTANIELPQLMMNLALGDVSAGASGFSGGLLLGGVQLSRNLAMDPSLLPMPEIGMRGLAQTPSTLEVYVDDRLVSRRTVAPGPFEVTRLPVSEGIGTARYVLRDAFGREQSVARPYTLARQALAPGLHAFTYSLGFERVQPGTESFSYAAPAFVGVHRVGLSEASTAEAGIHVTPKVTSFTPRVDFALPIGVLGVVASGSVAEGTPGVAAGLDYALMNRTLGLTASVRARSERYATVGLDPRSERASLSAELRASLSPAARWSVTAHTRVTAWRDHGVEGQFSANATWWALPRLSLSAGVTHLRGDAVAQTTASLLVNVVLDDTVTMTGTATLEGLSPRATIDVQRTPRDLTGLSARARVAAGNGLSGGGSVGYSGQHGRVSGGVEIDSAGLHPQLQASASLVVVGGRAFVARPVDSPFALVRAPGAPETRVSLDHHEVGETDASGDLLVQGLAPWRANRVELRFDDLPSSVLLDGSLETRVAPRPLSGAIASFETRELHAVRGSVRLLGDEAGALLARGTIELEDGQQSPLGSDGAFEFEQMPEGPMKFTARGGGISCRGELQVPVLRQPLTDLGEVTCFE